VDDNMACNVKEDSIEHILSFMNDVFQITIGYPKVYVGLHIIWVTEECVVHINLTWHILSKLKKYGYENCNLVVVFAHPNNVFDLSLHIGDGSMEDQSSFLTKGSLAIYTLNNWAQGLTFCLQLCMAPSSPKTHKCRILQCWNMFYILIVM